MKKILFILFVSITLRAEDLKLITPEEAPLRSTVCYVHLVKRGGEEDALASRLSSSNIAAIYSFEERLGRVLQAALNCPFQVIPELSAQGADEVISLLKTIAEHHIGQDVVVIPNEEFFTFLSRSLGIEASVSIPQGSRVVLEVDANTVYLRKNYGKLWRLFPFTSHA